MTSVQRYRLKKLNQKYQRIRSDERSFNFALKINFGIKRDSSIIDVPKYKTDYLVLVGGLLKCEPKVNRIRAAYQMRLKKAKIDILNYHRKHCQNGKA